MTRLQSAVVMMGVLLSPGLALQRVAQADWQGNLTMKTVYSDGHSVPSSSGTLKMKKDWVRMDLQTPREFGTILNIKTRKAWVLLPKQHLALETSLTAFGADAHQQGPLCAATDITGCLKRQGFKKVGTGEAEGHPCDIYEGKVGKKNPAPLRLWRPRDLKEVPSVKTVMQNGAGQTVETALTDIQTATLEDSVFLPPKNFITTPVSAGMVETFQKFQQQKGK